MLRLRSPRRPRPLIAAAIAGMAMAAAGCGGGDDSASGGGREPTIRAVSMEGTQALPLAVIEEQELDAKHGFALEQVPVAGAEAAYERAKQDSFQLGFGSWVTIALLRAQGFDLTAAYPLSTPTTSMLVRKDSPIRDFSDLRGKTVGLFGGPSSGTTVLLQVILDKYYGIAPDEVKYRSGAVGLLGAQLERGELDAALIVDPVVEKMIAAGEVRSVGDPALIWQEKAGYKPMQVNVMANSRWAEDNPALMRSFLTAYAEAKRTLLEDDAIWPKLAQEVGITDPAQATMYRDRIRKLLIDDWSPAYLDKQASFLQDVTATLGDVTGFPKSVPQGTFSTQYVPQESSS